MTIVLGLILVVLIGATAVVAAGHGEGLGPPDPDGRPLPDGDLDGDALRGWRFSTSIFGYRMSEVDAVLARLSAQLDSGSDRSSQ